MKTILKKLCHSLYTILFIAATGIAAITYSLASDNKSVTNYNQANTEVIIIDLQESHQINYILFIGVFLLVISFGLFLIKHRTDSIDNKLADRPQELTIREKEILHLVNSGMLNKEIAHELSISTSTVKSHVNNIFKKLNVKKRIDLMS